MKKETGTQKIYVALTVLVLIAVLFSGCFLSGTPGELVSPTIRAIGLPDASAVGSVTLTVTGPGMDPVEVSYSQLPSVINIAIPEGNDRTFELSVGTGDSYTGPIASYKGTATADITSDSAVVTLNMGVDRTKIVIPDAYNYRLVQIDDMSGAGWTTLSWADLGFTNDYAFLPYDVDFDQGGNILAANNYYNGVDGGIYIISSIDFTSLSAVPTYYAALDGNAPVTAVAVDRISSRVYGISWGGVYYWDSPGDYTAEVTVAGTPAGLAVDDEGNFYVAGSITTTAVFPWIVKYSNTLQQLDSYTGGTTGSINDVTVFNGELYASIGGSGAQIEMFAADDLAGGALSSFGIPGAPATKGELIDPHNFVAVMNKKIYLVDGTDYSAQMVSFDDITGTNWETYGSWDNTGDGIGVFKFFSSC